jgi:Fe-S-cluster containining protein
MERATARCRARVSAIAAAALPSARGDADLVALLVAVWRAVEEELAASRPPDEPAAACGPGCSACCTLNVGTLGLEGAVAAAFLRLRLRAGEVAARAEALGAFHDRIRWLEDRERIAGGLRCPFTDGDGRCVIHPVRPLACRSVSSLDAGECRRAMRGADDDGPGAVRMDLLQKALHDEALRALAAALAERGLDARLRDVTGMTAAFLADPALGAAFLAGGRIPLE